MKRLLLAVLILISGRLHAKEAWNGINIIGPEWFFNAVSIAMYDMYKHAGYLEAAGYTDTANAYMVILGSAEDNVEFIEYVPHVKSYLGMCSATKDGKYLSIALYGDNYSQYGSVLIHEFVHAYFQKRGVFKTEQEAEALEEHYKSSKRLFKSNGYEYLD